MKRTTQKLLFYGDFYIIKNIRLASLSIFPRLIIAFLLIFSSTMLLSFDTLAVEKNNQQLPVKKTTPTPEKRTSSSKIVKSKKVKKSKKSVVVKKDTLLDIDPATASSPLYKN